MTVDGMSRESPIRVIEIINTAEAVTTEDVGTTDKLTTAIGAGAAVGAAVGGKKGAIIGAIVGGGGAAAYTYGIRE